MKNRTLEEIMLSQEIEKLEQEIGRLKLLNFRLKVKNHDNDFIAGIAERKLEEISKQIRERFKKKMSGQYLVFNIGKDNLYIDPMFVKADSIEEALMPEDESYFRELVLPIPASSEFKDL